jgi:hypothetical protein
MKNSFTYWRDGKYYIGFLNQYPDYQTQAKTKHGEFVLPI